MFICTLSSPQIERIPFNPNEICITTGLSVNGRLFIVLREHLDSLVSWKVETSRKVLNYIKQTFELIFASSHNLIKYKSARHLAENISHTCLWLSHPLPLEESLENYPRPLSRFSGLNFPDFLLRPPFLNKKVRRVVLWHSWRLWVPKNWRISFRSMTTNFLTPSML